MGPRLEDPLDVGGCRLPNRLYRAPLLECAGNGEDAVDALIEELEPAAAAGAGLLFQGATIVRGEGGCAAPGMTRVHDPEFVADLDRLTDAVHDHGSRIFLQLEHGGLRSMETWHAGYRERNPDLQQLAVSELPPPLRVLDRLGVLGFDPHVLSTAEVSELAADFGRAAGRAVDAGYDGIHLAGANMGIVQQFLSPFYNRRDDEFGGSPEARTRFPELVHDEIRDRAGDVPLVTKVPAETAAPRFVRRRLTREDGVEIARGLADVGYDALVPVECSVVWDMSIVRGAYPGRAWADDRFDYAETFGSRWRARLVSLLNRLQARRHAREPAWNESFCRAVRAAVDVPVLLEGGVRSRATIDRLLGAAGTEPRGPGQAADDRPASDRPESPGESDAGPNQGAPAADGSGAPACDAVGMGRPFYAEPRLPARLLATDGARALCRSCNNCTVPQAAGADGICRTPEVMAEVGRRRREGEYDRDA